MSPRLQLMYAGVHPEHLLTVRALAVLLLLLCKKGKGHAQASLSCTGTICLGLKECNVWLGVASGVGRHHLRGFGIRVLPDQ
jgi:hypothetical protein